MHWAGGAVARHLGHRLIGNHTTTMLSKEQKDRIIKKFKVHDKDTGSPEVQIAILSEEIHQLTEHLQSHKKDFSSRRGLLRKVGQRRRLLRYLQKENAQGAEELAKKLKIKLSPLPDLSKDLQVPAETEEEMPAEPVVHE